MSKIFEPIENFKSQNKKTWLKRFLSDNKKNKIKKYSTQYFKPRF